MAWYLLEDGSYTACYTCFLILPIHRKRTSSVFQNMTFTFSPSFFITVFRIECKSLLSVTKKNDLPIDLQINSSLRIFNNVYCAYGAQQKVFICHCHQ